VKDQQCGGAEDPQWSEFRTRLEAWTSLGGAPALARRIRVDEAILHRWRRGDTRPMAGVRDQILKWITRAVSLEGLPELDAAVPGMPGTQTLRDVQARHVLRVLKACGGNKSHAARALGIDRWSLYRRIAWAGEVLKRGEADDEPGRIEGPGAVSTKPPAG
jgi:hypothetical protein